MQTIQMSQTRQRISWVAVAFMMLLGCVPVWGQEWIDGLEHKYVDNQGVKIHYVKSGKGPLVVFVHGFPDYWYSWRHQIQGLQDESTVVALDTRGYNLSDKPQAEEQYDMTLLVSDVLAVIKSEGASKATLVGHDWGGAICWSTAMAHPQIVEQLVIVNLPHMSCLVRELMAEDSKQHKASQYARTFQEKESHKFLNATILSSIVPTQTEQDRTLYKEAFEKSSINGLMNYYRRNYPREPYQIPQVLKIQMPVLQFHGLADKALLAPALNGTWEHLAKDWTLVTLPGVDHWAHVQQAEKVTQTMRWWLRMQRQIVDKK
ncbi:MAG: alpha/beta hydrolase [Acidobacteria bacterium]|nr:alpha/beta hydrolase [Acidobacteriota bacterium]